MNNWKDKEVKALFEEVEKCKTTQKPLLCAFAAHAKSFNRKPNSVRNYYYHEVDNLCSDDVRRQKLGVKLENHTKTHFESFDKIAEEELFEKVEKLVEEGLSVRAACMKLSGGDLLLMTRFQNKYQNMKRKLKVKDNVIPFKQQRKLSENDINSLVLGLVKLIKKTAQEEMMDKPNQLLKRAFLELNQKDQQLQQLKNEFEKLKSENRKLLEKVEGNKQEALRSHLMRRKTDVADNGTKKSLT